MNNTDCPPATRRLVAVLVGAALVGSLTPADAFGQATYFYRGSTRTLALGTSTAGQNLNLRLAGLQDWRLGSLGRSCPGVRSGLLITPRTRFGGVFLASAQTASPFAVSRHAWVASGTAQRL